MENNEFFKRYYQGPRDDIFRIIPQGCKRILDVGCAAGELGASLKKTGCYVVGIELNPQVAVIARTKLDMVIEGDVEKIELPFKENEFDCIILADILEHLINPAAILTKLKNFLSNGGFIVCSIPNVRHYSIIKDLIFGKWEYKDEGILDKTHLRFFTLFSTKRMLDDAGYKILHCQRQIKEGWKLRLLNIIFLNLFKDFITYHYLVVAKVKTND